jgi:hypothetical protein
VQLFGNFVVKEKIRIVGNIDYEVFLRFRENVEEILDLKEVTRGRLTGFFLSTMVNEKLPLNSSTCHHVMPDLMKEQTP